MSDYEKIGQLIFTAEELIKEKATKVSPEFKAWHSKTMRFLTNKYGENSVEVGEFKKLPFAPRSYISSVPHDNSIECLRDLKATIIVLKDYLMEESVENVDEKSKCKSEFSVVSHDKVFIVHGHNGELKEAVARLLEAQDIEAIILSEQVNQGKTIIEKFEEYSDVGAAIALFTKDDYGRKKGTEEDMPRARQNVVFEAGYFMGKLGRNRVVIIAEKGIEMPSDLQGVVYTDKETWKIDVCRELKAMNYSIDFNKMFRGF